MDNQGVSIVIVNFNTQEYIFKLLDSIRCFVKYRPLEIVVIDNLSTDGSREELERHQGIRYIKENRNITHGPALHRGMLESEYKYVLTLDPDTLILKEGLVEKLHQAMRDDNTFAAGRRFFFNTYGMAIGHPKRLVDYLRPSVSLINRQVIEYVHPYCSLLDRQIYLDKLSSDFIPHGSPGLAIYHEIHQHNRRNRQRIKLVHIENIDEYIRHYWARSWNKDGASFGISKQYFHPANRVKGASFLADGDYPIKTGLLKILGRLGIDGIMRRVIFRNPC